MQLEDACQMKPHNVHVSPGILISSEDMASFEVVANIFQFFTSIKYCHQSLFIMQQMLAY
jgi:hypothetical protein